MQDSRSADRLILLGGCGDALGRRGLFRNFRNLHPIAIAEFKALSDRLPIERTDAEVSFLDLARGASGAEVIDVLVFEDLVLFVGELIAPGLEGSGAQGFRAVVAGRAQARPESA